MEEEKIVSWEEVLTEGGYVKFERDKRKTVILTNCRVVEVEKPDYNDKEKIVTKHEFRADCLSEDGIPCQKILGIYAARFVKGISKLLTTLEGDLNKKTISVSVKKIGEGTGTNYDFEDFKEISSIQ